MLAHQSVSPRGFIKTVSDLAVVGWGPRTHISYHFQGDADTAGLGTCFESH